MRSLGGEVEPHRGGAAGPGTGVGGGPYFGVVFLLHSQESAVHSPEAKQFTGLGWTVVLPTKGRCAMQTFAQTKRLKWFFTVAAAAMSLAAASDASAQPVLTLEGSCPGPMRAEVRNAPRNVSAFLLFARSTGSFLIRGGACWGTTLGLSSQGLRQVGEAITDGTGFAAFEGNVGRAACGGYLQILMGAGGGCQTSNVVRIE